MNFQSDTSQVDKDIKWADAFLVVYSITDKNSFNNAIQLVEAIYDGKGTDELHVALVGNKIDLEHFRKGNKADIDTTINSSNIVTKAWKEIKSSEDKSIQMPDQLYHENINHET